MPHLELIFLHSESADLVVSQACARWDLDPQAFSFRRKRKQKLCNSLDEDN